jgi:peptidoglycan/xylan/chitin deacetylase (PgdA/CDA1 family)
MQLLDWTELESLAAAGWEIGSHGSSHLPLVAVSEPTARRETEEAKKSIERNLAIQVPLFAYPYGAHDESVRRIVADYHEAACGTRAAITSRSNLADRFDLPRIDAHYLRWLPVATTLGSPAGNAYLALRRWVSGFRRPHWDEKSLGRTT